MRRRVRVSWWGLGYGYGHGLGYGYGLGNGNGYGGGHGHRYDPKMDRELEKSLDRAAEAIASAEALLTTAGAGIGVDSGLPDFRGNEGFWRAYPPLRKLGISFMDMANPIWFKRDPELAWGFYGHRLGLYRATEPHDGFRILRRWGDGCRNGSFVFTSNVDGQFQRAGFNPDHILECHGSIHHLQCLKHCGEITRADPFEVMVDDETFRAAPPLPSCPVCGALARPNVLMFGDWGWLPERTSAQEQRFADWVAHLGDAPLVILEIGAGTAVPTVRMTSEQIAHRPGATLIRINVREPQAPRNHIGIAMGGLEALTQVDHRLRDA